MDLLKTLGEDPKAAAMWIITTVVGAIVSAVLKARRDAKKGERAMESVPHTPAPPRPPLDEIVSDLEQERAHCKWLQWQLRDAEQAMVALRAENERQASAISRERSEHQITRERERHYRTYARELEERVRAMGSGLTPLGPADPPARVVEVDDRPTPRQGTRLPRR